MNEVEELSKLDPAALPPLRSVLLDDLYQGVLKNLHLEVGRGPALYLLSPSYSVLNPTPDEAITEFITRHEALLDYLKEAIVQNLAAYSVLVDISSYFIEQNGGLVLARLRERDSEGRRFEIKFYTVSLKAQFERLTERAGSKLMKAQDFASYFQEIGDSVNELHTEGLLILQSLPPHLDYAKLAGHDLIEINAQYRTINHFVIELHDTVAEFENLLRYKERSDFVRYVTKYKKDVTNLISYFNIKVNGVIAQRIHACKSKHG
jgi:hypothetical protein